MNAQTDHAPAMAESKKIAQKIHLDLRPLAKDQEQVSKACGKSHPWNKVISPCLAACVTLISSVIVTLRLPFQKESK